ncbi:DUF530 domain-containing protein [Methanobrevibacter sp. OttesenSCG-928-I08]|nr:DUF530 domain-containing protein [Methanobrevibacter sp. OttesenSCG-928-I08]
MSKSEKFLNKIASDELNFENIEDFETFKSIYFTLCDNLDNLLDMRNIMDSQGYTSPFRSLTKYGVNAVEEVTIEERGEVSRHNQYFRMKAIAKKNVLERVISAIDAHKIAIGNLEEYGNIKCNHCYKTYRINDYKDNNERCTCNSSSFSFKVNNDRTYRVEILPYLPLSGNYMVLMTNLSKWGRNAFKKVLKVLKQERRGVVKTISLVIKYKDKNNRIIRKDINMDSEFVDNYEEEVRRQYGKNVRIEVLRFHRTKPAIINDKHARSALALAYTRFAEKIAVDIKDDLLKKNIADFKRLTKYDSIYEEIYSEKPSFIDNDDDLNEWRKVNFNKELKKHNYVDKFDNIKRSLKRDLKTRENIEKTIFTNIPQTLIMWDIFKYYLTTSYDRRKRFSGPFPYIRVELDRQQRSVFQGSYKKVIEAIDEGTQEKILDLDNMDLILYEKFSLEKLIKNSNMKINYPALGAALVSLNSDIDIEDISNAFDVNVSKIKKELKNIETLKRPKSKKSKKFLEMIKK